MQRDTAAQSQHAAEEAVTRISRPSGASSAGSAPSAPRPTGQLSPGPLHALGVVGSTQDEASQRLAAGERAPFTVTARAQRAGRGRLGRTFESPEGASLSLTHVHRTSLPPQRRGWFAHAAGLAALAAIGEVLGADGERLGLKWPNDLHTESGRKLGGILLEARGADHVLLGIGMNFAASPVPGAAWLRGPGGVRPGPVADEEGLDAALGAALARALVAELAALESAGGDGVLAGTFDRYTVSCLTFERAVRVDPLGEDRTGGAQAPSLHGVARSVDEFGRLVVELEGGESVAVDVGDVRHLRPVDPDQGAADDARGIGQEEHAR